MCRLDTTHHHPTASADTAVDTVMMEVGTAANTDHTAAEHNQMGCRLPAVEHCKLQPYAQTLHGPVIDAHGVTRNTNSRYTRLRILGNKSTLKVDQISKRSRI
ncbi:hypothetical protein Tco_0331475 [Tanacetum coccineum]